MANSLAIDWGKARIGVAAAYSGTNLAFPVETVPGNKDCLTRLAALVAQYEAELVYIGLPVTLEGKRSIAAQWVVEQARSLGEMIGAHKIRLIDERFSTVAASRNLGRVGRSQRESRTVIDQAAAVEILQRALDRQPSGLAGEPLDLEEQ